ncbi:MAG: hypothetical protein WEB58_14395 [Planctomycetaceae bacterium]
MAKNVLPQDDDAEREDWLRLSMEGLNAAYGEDEEGYSIEFDFACVILGRSSVVSQSI